jgi:hypothetical protein
MLLSFISKATRKLEKNGPVFERLKEEEQDGELDDYQWSQYSQRHTKLWNSVWFVFGILLGVAGLLVGQQTTFDVESIGPLNPAMPHSKCSIKRKNTETDDRQ